jgi:NADPH:quinone reductase-like Zn-dependent oxidoreductase
VQLCGCRGRRQLGIGEPGIGQVLGRLCRRRGEGGLAVVEVVEDAGTVDALGEGMTGIRVGDQVIGFLPMTGPGAAAEYLVAPAEVLTPAPRSDALSDAAALPLVGLTAWQALFEHAG